MAELTNTAFPVAFTPKNITSGFSAPGIFPLNKNAFSDDELAGSSVSDRPTPRMVSDPLSTPSGSTDGLERTVTPEQICPHPKAGPRKGGPQRGRRRVTAILTLTPKKTAPEVPTPATEEPSTSRVTRKRKRKVGMHANSNIAVLTILY